MKEDPSMEWKNPLQGLEWTSSHQCTSWRWARSARFADEHPPCPRCFFFHLFSAPPTSPLLSPLLPPPSYLPPTNPTPPHSIARARVVERKLELWSYCCGAGTRAARVGAGPTCPRDPHAHDEVFSNLKKKNYYR
jgi:hypothetical protein